MSSANSPLATLSRRHWLRVGGLGLLGISSAEWARLRAGSGSPPRANACVFVFLFGGPSHIDLWDMKPEAPLEVRGEFQPIATRVPGIQLCEHLPKLAAEMHRFALLRSMAHRMPVHGPACSEMYTGRPYFGPPVTDQARPQDWPSVASLVMRYGRSPGSLPPALVLPWYTQFVGQNKRIAGQTGGRMGDGYDPVLIAGDPSRADFEVPGLRLHADVGPRRLDRRRRLLQRLEKNVNPGRYGPGAAEFAGHARRAYSMLEQAAFRSALDLRSAPAAEKEAYGPTRFGQSLLLARRFVEAGVTLVTVNWDDETRSDKVSPHWDTHHDNFAKLKGQLCPNFDRAFAAFLKDLDERGLLETTLVVVTGEFGRTPKMGQFSQNAMTKKTGRDHWPHAFTVLLAGGGVRGGQAYGATTRNGGYVADRPVSPADLAATVFAQLGIDTSRHYLDRFQRVEQQVCEGRPIADLG